MVTASDLRSTGRGFDSQPFHYQVATVGKLFTHMCLCHQAVQFGTGQRAVMLCGWEGNRRPGVEGDEHPTYALGMVDFTLL